MSGVSPAQQQALMLAALLGKDQLGALQLELLNGQAEQTERGIHVYQANAAVLAERTLSSTFPVLAQLIGTTSFEPLARYFWRQHPPQRGDMGQWGEPLAEFLDAAPQLANEPFLGDVARVEWALHRAACAADAALNAASFSLLSEDSPQPVSLAVSPGAYTLESRYPVTSIINAHLSSEPTLAEVAEWLRIGRGEHALVWRQGFKPRVRTSSAAECALINGLLQSLSLDAALSLALIQDPAFDFNTWLGQAVQTGLVFGAYQLSE